MKCTYHSSQDTRTLSTTLSGPAAVNLVVCRYGCATDDCQGGSFMVPSVAPSPHRRESWIGHETLDEHVWRLAGPYRCFGDSVSECMMRTTPAFAHRQEGVVDEVTQGVQTRKPSSQGR